MGLALHNRVRQGGPFHQLHHERRRAPGAFQAVDRRDVEVVQGRQRLRFTVARCGVEPIAPHRRTRIQRTQDGRPLRRYRRRWKIERLFAWLQNFRRIVVRYERFAENFLGMLHLACCLILLRGL
jgi:IS4 transposase